MAEGPARPRGRPRKEAVTGGVAGRDVPEILPDASVRSAISNVRRRLCSIRGWENNICNNCTRTGLPNEKSVELDASCMEGEAAELYWSNPADVEDVLRHAGVKTMHDFVISLIPDDVSDVEAVMDVQELILEWNSGKWPMMVLTSRMGHHLGVAFHTPTPVVADACRRFGLDQAQGNSRLQRVFEELGFQGSVPSVPDMGDCGPAVCAHAISVFKHLITYFPYFTYIIIWGTTKFRAPVCTTVALIGVSLYFVMMT